MCKLLHQPWLVLKEMHFARGVRWSIDLLSRIWYFPRLVDITPACSASPHNLSQLSDFDISKFSHAILIIQTNINSRRVVHKFNLVSKIKIFYTFHQNLWCLSKLARSLCFSLLSPPTTGESHFQIRHFQMIFFCICAIRTILTRLTSLSRQGVLPGAPMCALPAWS